MEFSAYARIVLQRWRLIIALILLATVTAYVTNAQGPVAYRATASLSVTPSIVEYWTGQAVERLLNNYALQIRSRPFASIVAKAAGLPEDALTGRIRAVAAPLNSDFPSRLTTRTLNWPRRSSIWQRMPLCRRSGLRYLAGNARIFGLRSLNRHYGQTVRLVPGRAGPALEERLRGRCLARDLRSF